MELLYHYAASLRQKTVPVTVFDAALKDEAKQMFEIMRSNAGLGLAANQVGLNKQLLVYGYHRSSEDDELPEIPFTAIVNPRIINSTKETESLLEGCLSLPGLELPVVRSVGVTIKAQDLSGKVVNIKAKGLLARILQHEIDHLNGVLFTDRASKNQISSYKNYQWLRAVFIGSDDFSSTVFTALHEAIPTLAVITETAKRSGRGESIEQPQMYSVAQNSDVAIFQPESKEEITDILRQLKPDLIILASYGKILPAEALSIPVYGALNLHPSLLPKYRGATPIQSALLNNESVTGSTLQVMSEQVDAGSIVAQAELEIERDDDYTTLKNKLAKISGELLLDNLPKYLCSLTNLLVQDEKLATSTKKLSKTDGEIDWDRSVNEIVNRIRALNPWPGTYTFIDGKRLIIKKAKITDGLIEPVTVQLEGKNETDWRSFLNGYAKQLTNQRWAGKIYQ